MTEAHVAPELAGEYAAILVEPAERARIEAHVDLIEASNEDASGPDQPDTARHVDKRSASPLTRFEAMRNADASAATPSGSCPIAPDVDSATVLTAICVSLHHSRW